jgi:hypothetical protein
MQDRNYEAAREELRNLVIRRPHDLELRRSFHKLCMLTRHAKKLTGHGAEFIELLFKRHRIREASEIYQDCVALDHNFRPEKPDQYYPIAQMLRECNASKQAVQLINGFHKQYPRSDLTPQLYLLAARIFHDDLGDTAQATQILRFLENHCSRHPLIGDVKRYHSVLRIISPSRLG